MNRLLGLTVVSCLAGCGPFQRFECDTLNQGADCDGAAGGGFAYGGGSAAGGGYANGGGYDAGGLPEARDAGLQTLATASDGDSYYRLQIHQGVVYSTKINAKEVIQLSPGGPLSLETANFLIESILVDQGDLYYWGGAGLFRIHLTDTSPTPVPVIAPVRPAVDVDNFAVDQTNYYYSSGSGIWKLARDAASDAGATQFAVVSSFNATGLAAGDGLVVWTDMKDDVVKAPIDGGPATFLATGQASATGLKVANGIAYWVTGQYGHQAINKVSLSGGTPTVLIGEQGSVRELTIDDSTIYWTDQKLGTIQKMPITGGAAPTLLAEGQAGAASIAVDSDSVYWTVFGNALQASTIMKAAK